MLLLFAVVPEFVIRVSVFVDAHQVQTPGIVRVVLYDDRGGCAHSHVIEVYFLAALGGYKHLYVARLGGRAYAKLEKPGQ